MTMTVARLKARTGEEISFKFESIAAFQLNNNQPPYQKEPAYWYDITGRIHVSVTIPGNRQKPNSIILKLNNVNNCEYFVTEYREIILKGYTRYDGPANSYFQTETGGIIAKYYSQYQSGNSTFINNSTQIAEFILDFGNRMEALTCPVNGTSKFNMCFYNAHIAQQGEFFSPNDNKLFYPSVDGYSFSNSRASFGYGVSYSIPLERYEDVFGPVVANVLHNPNAIWGGSCFGFATTAGLFFTNNLLISKREVKTVFEIPTPKSPVHAMTTLIEKFQICWSLDGVGNRKNFSIDKLIAAVADFQNTSQNPVVIAVYRTSDSGTVGHALIGYKVTQDSSGYAVSLYDCNYPNQTHTLKIGTDKKTWDYGDYKSSDTKGCICFLLSNSIGEKMIKHLDDGAGSVASSEKIYLSVSTGDVEIYNSNGTRVEEIEGIEKIVICDGQTHNDIAYYLPQDSYHIVPKSEASSQESQPFTVGVADDETSISACNASAFEATVTLGDEPQLDIEDGSGEFELSVVTTKKDFSEDKVKVRKRGGKGAKGGKSSTVSFMGKRPVPDDSQVRLKSDGMRTGKKNSKILKFTFKME